MVGCSGGGRGARLELRSLSACWRSREGESGLSVRCSGWEAGTPRTEGALAVRLSSGWAEAERWCLADGAGGGGSCDLLRWKKLFIQVGEEDEGSLWGRRWWYSPKKIRWARCGSWA